MFKSFADRRTQALYAEGKAQRIPADVVPRARRKLEYIDLAANIEDLRVPPGNRLHVLSDTRGQYSIAVNDQWRICFRYLEGDAYDVEFCVYH